MSVFYDHNHPVPPVPPVPETAETAETVWTWTCPQDPLSPTPPRGSRRPCPLGQHDARRRRPHPTAPDTLVVPIKRQESDNASSSVSAESSYTWTPTPTSSDSSTYSSSQSAGSSLDGTAYTTGTLSPSINSSSSYSYTETSAEAPSSSSSSSSSWSSTISKPWKTSTRTTSSHAAGSTPYVPGVVLPLTLAGDSDSQAVYSVRMSFGHGTQDGSSQRKRRSSSWNGGDPQTVNMQVDLGSSDMWVASTSCTSADCTSAPYLFNASQSLDADTSFSFSYQTGSISGDLYWEAISLGGFGIGYQAFDTVSNENLSGGNFTGILGLAFPANSQILKDVPGSTSNDPDGATFLDNLFGGGSSAPTNRLLSLSLERANDVRTSSSLGIGAISDAYCPSSSCTPDYLSIVAQSSLGATGFLYWRLLLSSITATTWADEKLGTGPTKVNIALGSSRVDTTKYTPLAVLDSGGVAILSGYKQWTDNIYSAFGVSASPDGLYRMACTKQIALSFNFGSRSYAVHPLDMSWPDPDDVSQQTCIGAIQYSDSLGKTGDFILGSAFLKNVYSIYRYPDNNGTGKWQPSVGLVSITNASVASQDFYAVRVDHESLSSVSANHQSGVGPANPSASTVNNPSASAQQQQEGKRVTSTAVIAGCSVVGFFVFAAGLFSAWWFWHRRRHGKNGKVVYPAAPERKRSDSRFISASTRRNNKHDSTQRQKSYIDGISEYEDSWMSTTEGGESIALGYIPEEAEEAEEGLPIDRRVTRSTTRTAVSSTRSVVVADADADEPVSIHGDTQSNNLVDLAPPVAAGAGVGAGGSRSGSSSRTRDSTPRGRSESSSGAPRRISLSPEDASGSRYPSAYAYPSKSKSPSLSMAGPFPSTSRQTTMGGTDSPYDVFGGDYFAVPLTSTVTNSSVRGLEKTRQSSTGRSGTG